MIKKQIVEKTIVYPDTFQPPLEEELWCNKCDQRTVLGNDLSTGKFFVVFGHAYRRDKGKYDGDYTGVMFALCSECLSA